MGDRNFSQQSACNPEMQLGDSLPTVDAPCLSEAMAPAAQQAEAVLTEKLDPAQLRAVASWMRAIATTYDCNAPAEVAQSFRTQASRLDQLARQAKPDAEAVIGTLMSDEVAYLMTATAEYLRQALSGPNEAEAVAEPCGEAEFRQAYLNPDFTVLLGAERLEQCFGPRE